MRIGQAQRTIRQSHQHGPGAASRNWDATRAEAPPELLQAGFWLANFIIPDREIAIDILVRALEKVKVQSRREIKKLYWRDKHAERPVRRMARSDMDMLQWLIMFESEEDERAQEKTSNSSLRGMAIRYIKHLVQITTALSSFYVSVGLTRLLRTYSTAEAQRAYEMLSNRYLGADEYRRAKAMLMNKMNQRFAGFLRTTRMEHGELRFESVHDQTPWLGLVDACLKAFTPWSTWDISSQFPAAEGDNDTLLTSLEIDRNEIELKCCHIFIEPKCFTQLVKELALEPPAAKLALPRFHMNEKQEKDGDDGAQQSLPLELSEEELGKIEQRLAATDARRRNFSARFVTVVIDDKKLARLDLNETAQWEMEVEAGANLLEIRGQDNRGELVLATHLISYVNDAFDISTSAAMLHNGKLRLRVAPIVTSGQEPARAVLNLNYHPSVSEQFATAWHAVTSLRGKIGSYAFAALTTALVVCGGAAAFYAHKVNVLGQRLQEAQHNRQQLSPTAAGAIVSYALSRDEDRVRGSESPEIPEISLRLHSSAVSLELPLSSSAGEGSYTAELKTFSGDRTLLTQNFLQPTRRDSRSEVEIVVPGVLLEPDTYYTVHLHGPSATDHFTFKVVSADSTQ